MLKEMVQNLNLAIDDPKVKSASTTNLSEFVGQDLLEKKPERKKSQELIKKESSNVVSIVGS